jgi:hypothetical protein
MYSLHRQSMYRLYTPIHHRGIESMYWCTLYRLYLCRLYLYRFYTLCHQSMRIAAAAAAAVVVVLLLPLLVLLLLLAVPRPVLLRTRAPCSLISASRTPCSLISASISASRATREGVRGTAHSRTLHPVNITRPVVHARRACARRRRPALPWPERHGLRHTPVL